MSPALSVTKVLRIPDAGYVVLTCGAGRTPSIVDFRTPGALTAWLTHDDGMSWPDRRGEMLMKAVVAECGTVGLLFDRFPDADSCRSRLLKWEP